jgi:hypothetical protein
MGEIQSAGTEYGVRFDNGRVWVRRAEDDANEVHREFGGQVVSRAVWVTEWAWGTTPDG